MIIQKFDWKMKLGISLVILGFIIFLVIKAQKNQSTFETMSSQIIEECSKIYYCENKTEESNGFYYIDQPHDVVIKMESHEVNEWIQRSTNVSKKLERYSQTFLSKVIFSNCKNEETSQRVASSLENLKFSVSKKEKFVDLRK